MQVLVVDDEPAISDPLADYLVKNGCRVTVASDADAARAELSATTPDIVLLDVMMPGEDGLSLLSSIRRTMRVPIILLTARAEDTDRIVGLEMGADDYVAKPFNPRELLARMKAVLRRGEVVNADEDWREGFGFAGFTLDTSARQLTDPDGKPVVLTGGEYALLFTFLSRAGRVLSRDQLLDLTQGREAGVFDRSIDNQVSRLRKKIEKDPKAPEVIKTVRGGGYVLAAKVKKS